MVFLEEEEKYDTSNFDIYGYEKCDSEEIKEYEKCVQIIKDSKLKTCKTLIKNIPITQLKKQVKNNFENIFSNTNLEVKHVNSIILDGCNVSQKCLELLYKNARNISVFKVPAFYSGIFNVEYSTLDKDTPVIIEKFNLGKQMTDICYVHEIGHALTVRNKGYTKNFLYGEFASAFIELLYTYIYYDNKTFSKLLLSRLRNIRTTFYEEGSEYYNIKRNEYLISNIFAFDTFFKYLESSNLIKKEMIKDLESVFNGYSILEEFFCKYDIGVDKIVLEKAVIRTINLANKR